MTILIDSHALIWFLDGDAQLSANALAALNNNQYDKYVSKATLWEMAIKINLGKLKISKPLSDLPAFMAAQDFQLYSFSFNHILKVSALPLIHRDPFDRMLIAQALSDNLTVVTKDPNFSLYGVDVLW
jgi:PIN domain nuclease of toxin-antitoxin system